MNQLKLSKRELKVKVNDFDENSELLYNILNRISEDTLTEISENLSVYSKYKPPMSRQSLTITQYVYRTLAAFDTFSSIYLHLPKEKKDLISNIIERGGKVDWSAFRDTINIRFLRELQSYGLVFILPDGINPEYVVLPIEFRFHLVLPHHEQDQEGLFLAFKYLGGENIKKIAFYINEIFKCNHNADLSKASHAAFIYDFFTTRGPDIKKKLTQKHKEIILYIVENGNKVDLDDIMQKYPMQDGKGHTIYPGEIYQSYKPFVSKHKEKIKHAEVRELFLMGVLMIRNPDWDTKVFIPSEIFPTVASEYLENLVKKKQDLLSETVSTSPPGKTSISDHSIYSLAKKILMFLVYSYVKSTKKGGISKSSIKKCAKALNTDNAEHIDCLSMFILLNGYATNSRDSYFILADKGNNLLMDKMPHGNFWKGIGDFFLTTIDWNEMYLAPNRLTNTSSDSLNRNIKMLIYKCLVELPHQWLKTVKLKELLYSDYEFTKIRTYYDKEINITDGRYSGYQKPEYQSLDGTFFSVLRTMHYLGLLDVVDAEKGCSHVRLSKTIKALMTQQQIETKQATIKLHGKIIIQPNNEIICMPGIRPEIMSMLGKFTEIKKIDHTITFELSQQSLTKGHVEFELEFSQIKEFLVNYSEKAIPQNINYMFKQMKSKEDLLTVGRSGGYIIANDNILMEEIKNLKALEKYIDDSCVLPVLLLKPDANIKEALRVLRKKGYLPKEAKNMTVQTPSHKHTLHDDDYYF